MKFLGKLYNDTNIIYIIIQYYSFKKNMSTEKNFTRNKETFVSVCCGYQEARYFIEYQLKCFCFFHNQLFLKRLWLTLGLSVDG